MRELAGQGRTIFLSSHLMSEMALTADHILVLGRGRILADAGVADIIARSSGTTVLVRSPQAAQVVELLRGPDVTCTAIKPGAVEVAAKTLPALHQNRRHAPRL